MSEDQRFNQASALPDSAGKAFFQTLWRSSRDFNASKLSSCLEFLERERKRESRVNNPAYSRLCVKHIFSIGSIVREAHDKSASELQALVENSLSSLDLQPEVLQDTIILVIRLTFMVRVEFHKPYFHPSPCQLQMEFNQSFEDTLNKLQTEPPSRERSMQHELPLWFNVIDLERKANLRIGWTDYLNEHLTYQNGTVMLFRHVEVLEYMERSEFLAGKFFKQEFLQETRRSIRLFSPRDEYKYRDWFQSQSQSRGPIEKWRDYWSNTTPTHRQAAFLKTFPFGIASSYIFSTYQTIKAIGILKDCRMMITFRLHGGLDGVYNSHILSYPTWADTVHHEYHPG